MKIKIEGWNIVVVDNGFVFVGQVTGTKVLLVDKAKQLRKWGTTAGLGQLRSGPTKDTLADPVDVLLIPAARVVFAIPVDGTKWGG